MGINARQFKALVKRMYAINEGGSAEDLHATVRTDETTGKLITDFDVVVETDDLKIEALQGENALVNMFNKAVE